VNNNYLDLGMNKSGFVHTLHSGRLRRGPAPTPLGEAIPRIYPFCILATDAQSKAGTSDG
jgi:hypothetical protein